VLQKGAESEIDNSVQINNFFQKIKESWTNLYEFISIIEKDTLKKKRSF
jgi:hypothetical protein